MAHATAIRAGRCMRPHSDQCADTFVAITMREGLLARLGHGRIGLQGLDDDVCCRVWVAAARGGEAPDAARHALATWAPGVWGHPRVTARLESFIPFP